MLRSIKLIAVVFLFLAPFYACDKEEPLSPNEDAAAIQQLQLEIANQGGGNGNGGGGGTGGSGGTGGGGGTTIVEYFDFEVDGVSFSNSDPGFLSLNGQNQISSTATSLEDLVQISVFQEIEVKTYTNFVGGYYKSTTNVYQSFNGQFVLDTVNSEMLQGTFYFDAENDAATDTVSITNGRFKIAR